MKLRRRRGRRRRFPSVRAPCCSSACTVSLATQPAVFHGVLLAAHLATVLIVFVLVRRMFRAALVARGGGAAVRHPPRWLRIGDLGRGDQHLGHPVGARQLVAADRGGGPGSTTRPATSRRLWGSSSPSCSGSRPASSPSRCSCGCGPSVDSAACRRGDVTFLRSGGHLARRREVVHACLAECTGRSRRPGGGHVWTQLQRAWVPSEHNGPARRPAGGVGRRGPRRTACRPVPGVSGGSPWSRHRLPRRRRGSVPGLGGRPPPVLRCPGRLPGDRRRWRPRRSPHSSQPPRPGWRVGWLSPA